MIWVLLEPDHQETWGAASSAKKLGRRILLLPRAIRSAKPLELRTDRLLEDIRELPVPEKGDPH